MRALGAPLAILFGLACPAAASGATFTVNTTVDAADSNLADGICDSDPMPGEQCTLRAAIQHSNGSAGTADVIAFNVPSLTPVIAPTSALPTISDPATIDGTTQPTGRIEISGSSFAPGSGISGLDVIAGQTTIRKIVVGSFPVYGIRLRTNGGNTLEGNWVGIGADGFTARPNGNGGVSVEGGANNVIGGAGTIGATGVPRANVVSGNQTNQIGVAAAATPTTIQGNRIGTNADGTAGVPSSANGIKVDGNGNAIGGGGAGEGNLVAGGIVWGILVQGGDENTIKGNVIGLDVNGESDISPNANVGIQLSSNSLNNVVGGAGGGDGNVISGANVGLVIGQGATGNKVSGNRIGTNAAGATATPNAGSGVTIGAASNTIAGTRPLTATSSRATGATGSCCRRRAPSPI